MTSSKEKERLGEVTQLSENTCLREASRFVRTVLKLGNRWWKRASLTWFRISKIVNSRTHLCQKCSKNMKINWPSRNCSYCIRKITIRKSTEWGNFSPRTRLKWRESSAFLGRGWLENNTEHSILRWLTKMLRMTIKGRWVYHWLLNRLVSQALIRKDRIIVFQGQVGRKVSMGILFYL